MLYEQHRELMRSVTKLVQSEIDPHDQDVFQPNLAGPRRRASKIASTSSVSG